MTHLRLAWRLLATRGMRHALTAGIVALGLGLMLGAVATAEATRGALSASAARHPLVVGAEIGAVPLVLGSLTQLTDLSAGIDGALYEELRDDPRVEAAIPLLGGHAVEGYPLLATSPAYLEPRERYPLAAGRTFREGEMEVVLGHDAALGLGVDFGGAVTIEHAHAGAPEDPGQLTVVGVLAPTGSELDRTLLCPVGAIHRSHHAHHEHESEIESEIEIEHENEIENEHEVETSGSGFQRDDPAIHGDVGDQGERPSDGATGADRAVQPVPAGASEADRALGASRDQAEGGGLEHEHEVDHGHHHDHGDRISAILVRPADDEALLALQEELDARPGVEVALTGQTLRRIADQLSLGGDLVRVMVAGVVLVTFLSLLLAMYGSSLTQAREVGLMRVLGARRWEVVGVVLLVHALVIGAGLLGALAIAGLLGGSAEQLLRQQAGLEATVTLWTPTTLNYLIGTSLILALVAAQPVLAAYGVQAADALADVPGSGRTTGTWLRWVLRVAAPLAVAAFLLQALSQHNMELESLPLDPESAEVYAALSRWVADAPPDEVEALDGQRRSLQGYMYVLGDPYTTEDFYLVGLNPRLPRCPFCYRAPTRRERIHVDGGGRSHDVIAGPVLAVGTLHVDPDAPEPVTLQLEQLDVVMP